VALFVKICGVTNAEDAITAVDLGASAVGINLIRTSKRAVSESVAKEIASAITGRAIVVGVVADLPVDELRRVGAEIGFDRLQLHGAETPDIVRAASTGYKAVPIGDRADVEAAERFSSDPLLLDAKVVGAFGGTGVVFDWALVVELAARRAVLIAGGLTPHNVAEAIRVVRPWGVDVSSGVERTGNPRRKDPEKMRAFIDNARAAGQR
jgi:phosphoribosylanthranilate isomerase